MKNLLIYIRQSFILSPLRGWGVFPFLFIFPLFLSAQEVEDGVNNFEDEEVEGEEIPTNTVDTTGWSPEQKWVYTLGLRLDSVLRQRSTTTVTYTKGKGRHKRHYTKTVAARHRVGVCLYDLTSDSVIYAHNDHDMYIPASNQKVFVATTALSDSGAVRHFYTDVYVDGRVETDHYVLIDTLWAPRDSLELATAGGRIFQAGRDTIRTDSVTRPFLKGNIYVQGGFDPTLDKNAVDFVTGKIMALDIDSIDGYVYSYEPQKSLISSESWFWKKHPSRYFAQSIYEALKENEVGFSRKNAYSIINSPMADKGQELTELYTPLPVVLQRMMKRSDNYYAESVLLNLCNPKETNTWSYESCKQKVRALVAKAGGNPAEFVIADGSGLSHSNQCTPYLLCQVLRYAYQNKYIFDPLYESLPIAGVDGTLIRRLKGTPGFRNVRAKTGTVNGVSTLSGYVTAPNGHFITFSILVNNTGDASAHTLQDKLCVEMATE